MGVRSVIAKAFRPDSSGTVSDLSALIEAQQLGSTSSIPDQSVQSLHEQGMGYGRPFSPGQPIPPVDGYGNTPRSRDFITGINISSRPRHNEQVAFSTLKGIVNAYDVAQMCIWHRIDSIRSLDWSLTAKQGETGDVSKAVERGMAVLRKPDREFPFKTWLAKYLFDILAYDAGALYRMRNNAGVPVGLRVVDGTTIAPLVDYWGNRPTGDAPAFVQFAQGIPWEWLRAEDMIYEPFRPQTSSMYGRAPMESILLNANTDLRFQNYFLNRFTEGNVPEGFAESPEGWSPDQIREYQDAWDAMLYGDDTQKHQIKWIPHGTNLQWTNEKDFNDTFSLFLMRKTAAAYHVVPSDLGFTETVNLASSESQVDVQFRVGDLPLMQHVEGILTAFLQDDLKLPVEFEFDTGKETEDRLQTAQAHKVYVDMGVISVSDIREEVYGLPEPDGNPVPRFIMAGRAGPIPLSSLFAAAGPTDPETGAPDPDAPLPTKPFVPIEGVAPQGTTKRPALPPTRPPLAAVQHPEANPELLLPGDAVVSKGEGAGVSVAATTVAPASPMLAEDEDEDEDDGHKPTEVEKSAERKAFARYMKNRREGKWRDFEFSALDTAEAREANRRGRAQVRKAAGDPTVAGLVVRAVDTGRVLMLQRGLNPADPASGMWEFPGGHVEDGETLPQAAVREWCEETGCEPPAVGRITNQWTSSNGIYQGIVLEVPDESCCCINPDERWMANPDDPDGDIAETCAWWDPALLQDNPAVRAELADDLGLVLSALGSPVVKANGWEDHPLRRVDQALIEFHAPLIHKAMKTMVTKEQIRDVVARYLGQ